VESKKAGFADRNAILADPEFIEVNVEKILSKGNIDKRYAQITMEKAATDIAPVSEGSDTTYFLVADKDGNALLLLILMELCI
jgi:gamma-glutamyltranspeptidase/glutathione hydrolase